ncbi:MAG: hypothetical protein ACKO8U_18380, partial [Pirellula sp.]
MPHANRSTLRQRLRRMVATFLTTEVRGTRSAWLKPTYEGLEDRSLLAVATWRGTVDSDWQNPANWLGSYRPTQDDTVTLGGSALLSRRNITNVSGTVSQINVTSPFYTLNGSFDQPLIVSNITSNQNVTFNVKTILQSTVVNPNAGVVISNSSTANFWEVEVASAAQVTGLGYSRMNVGLLELNDQLSIVSTDSNGIGQFDVTQNLSGLDGNLLIQGDTFVTIASGTGFEGSILASQASLNVRGDL